ncbi:MAG: low molecular weight protein-tyrosine-phosphatase [Planctomycetota bacterium]|jgi:protein-tyrosine phosphatase
MTTPDRTSVLFVCLGNICRSPLAEGVFLKKINDRGVAARFRVDSAGTGAWHVGEQADHRMRRVAAQRGVKLISRARQVRDTDLHDFDLLVCMDEENQQSLLGMGAPAERVRLLLEYDPEDVRREVPDPYYGGDDGFHTVFQLVDAACEAMLDELLAATR